MAPSLRSIPRRRAFFASVVLVVPLAGCVVTSEVSALPQDRMAAIELSAGQVERLGLADVGAESAAWLTREGDPTPGRSITSLSGFDRSHGIGAIEVFPGDVASFTGDASERTVAVRPAWTSRVDNTSDTPNRSTFADDVTVGFLHPGSPGQHPGEGSAPSLAVEATVDVPANTCIDLVSLQVWQLGPPQIDHQPGDVQAEFLGTVLAQMPCL